MAVQGQFTSGGAVEFKLRVDTSDLHAQMDEIITKVEVAERVVSETLGLIRRMSGSDDINLFIGMLQKAIALSNTLMVVSNLMAMGTPAGWVLAGIGMAGFVLSIADIGGSF